MWNRDGHTSAWGDLVQAAGAVELLGGTVADLALLLAVHGHMGIAADHETTVSASSRASPSRVSFFSTQKSQSILKVFPGPTT